MRTRTVLALALFSSILPGCGSPSAPVPATTYPSLNGNWQIESGGGVLSPAPTAGILMVGALESQGGQVIGTFRFSNFAATFGACPLNQVITLSGSVTSAGSLTLTSATFSGYQLTLQVAIPSVATQKVAVGTIAVTGSGPCAFASGPALALLNPSITASYQGPVTLYQGLSGANPPASGSALLTLVQASTPNSDGTFPVTGSAQFASGSCTVSTPVTGTISGLRLILASAPGTPFGGANLTIDGVVTPTPVQAEVDFYYGTGPCSSGSLVAYQGTLPSVRRRRTPRGRTPTRAPPPSDPPTRFDI